MIVFGNSAITYLFEKIAVYQLQVCDQNRLERKRLALINKEVELAKQYLGSDKIDQNMTQNIASDTLLIGKGIEMAGVSNREKRLTKDDEMNVPEDLDERS